MSNLIRKSEDKYYLEPDTEITKEQYDAISAAVESGASGSTSEADILRLHQEQDPASPLYKGSEPVESGVSELASGESKSISRYYEPSDAELETIAAEQPEPAGTTVITTEEATIPPVIEETPKAVDVPETPEPLVEEVQESETPNGTEGSADTAPPEVDPEVAETPAKKRGK